MPSPDDPTRMVNARRFFMSFATNRVDDAIHLLSPEVTYIVPGHSTISGVYHGPDEVRRHLATVLEVSKGAYDVLKWVDWMAGETHVAVLQRARLQRRGLIYHGHHLFVVQFDCDDALSVVTIYFEDQYRADRFFSWKPD